MKGPYVELNYSLYRLAIVLIIGGLVSLVISLIKIEVATKRAKTKYFVSGGLGFLAAGGGCHIIANNQTSLLGIILITGLYLYGGMMLLLAATDRWAERLSSKRPPLSVNVPFRPPAVIRDSGLRVMKRDE